MTPVQPPSPDEIAAGERLIEHLVTIVKWVGGPAAAAWVAARFLTRASFRAGEEKRKYEELSEDVEAIKDREKAYITVSQHDTMQKMCTQQLISIIDNRTHASMTELRLEMAAMNGNICKIMGSLGINDDGNTTHNRRSYDRVEGK